MITAFDARIGRLPEELEKAGEPSYHAGPRIRLPTRCVANPESLSADSTGSSARPCHEPENGHKQGCSDNRPNDGKGLASDVHDKEFGKNGGETIRIGDSKTSMMTADCLVEGNVFYRCDGETECISKKSCGNTYRGNWFVETQGTLTLRHGTACLVEGNVFRGKKRGKTGGIRVIGEDHRIIGNYLRDLEGYGFRSAISLVSGIPDSPENGYLQVKGAVIKDNLAINCNESLLIGHNDVDEAILPPQDCRFEGNRIRAREGRPSVRVERAALNSTWEGNLYMGELVGLKETEGLEKGKLDEADFPEVPASDAAGPTWMESQ